MSNWAVMSISRRLFLKRVALGGGAIALASAVASQAQALAISRPPLLPASLLPASLKETAPIPVVAFFDGQLWVDPSGTSEAYRAPHGTRSAEPLSMLTQSELHS